MLLLAFVGSQAELDDCTGGDQAEEKWVEAEHLQVVLGD